MARPKVRDKLLEMGELNYKDHKQLRIDLSSYYHDLPKASSAVGRTRGSNDNRRLSKSIPVMKLSA